MKRFRILVAVFAVWAAGATSANATDMYFDLNDDGDGSGVQDDTLYAWNLTDTFWNEDANGNDGSGPGQTVAWVNGGGDKAIFSAGTDGAGKRFALNIGTGEAAPVAGSALLRAGTHMLVNSGVLNTGTGGFTVGEGIGQGAIYEVTASPTTKLNSTAKLVLHGGTYLSTINQTVAHSMLSTTQTLEINGEGTIDMQETGTNRIGIYGGAGGTILGTGGTTSNGGSGTLIIAGDPTSEFRYQGIGMPNSTFAKLKLTGPLFRLGFANDTQDERGFGAVPTAVLPDAITIDGGSIGLSFSTTTHVNRGITIGANGAVVNGNGAGTLSVPGPLTSNGATLTIFGRNLTTTSTSFGQSSGGLTLGNANNTSTFQNSPIQLDTSTLTLNESLNAASLNGISVFTSGGVGNTAGVGNASATATGTVTIAAGKTFTVGSDNTDMSYAGRVTGAGSFTKTGTGTLLLDTIAATVTKVPTDPAYDGGALITLYSGEWSNTGGVNINNGSIKFGTGNAGFATTAPVSILAPGTLDMNGINDTFASLSGAGTVKMDNGGTTAGNLTLAGTVAGPITFSGNISKNGATTGGNLTKSGAGSTHVLSGTNSVNVLAANAGTLLINGSTTASGGVTVAAAGTLGGTGTIVGSIVNSGTLAPGASVGTLNVTGNVTSATGSHWAIELSGATADKVAVTGNINLTAAGDFLDITGSGTGSSWLIGTYTGTLNGVFDNITSGYTVSYTGGNIMLNVAAGLPGDFNSNGTVDAADYVTWRKNGEPNTGGAGALPNDGGAADQNARFALWRANFGNPPSGGGLGASSAVPEPTALVLVLLGLGAMATCRRGR